MLPINNNIQSVSQNNEVIEVSFNQLLISQWKEWAKNGNPGEGEQRDCALYRLIDCLERGTITLALDNLFLTSLPDNLPPSIKQLNICGNPLTSLDLDKLPPSLRYLILSKSQTPLLSGDLLSKIPHLEILDGQPPFVIGSSIIN